MSEEQRKDGIDRRTMLKLTAGAAGAIATGYLEAAPGAVAQPKRPAKLADRLHAAFLTDKQMKDFMTSRGEPFTREFGVKWTTEVFGINERMLANLRVTKGEYDIVDISDFAIYPAVQEGLLEPLRMENVPNYKNLDRQWQSPVAVPSADKYVVVSRPGMYLYVRTADKIPEEQDSYAPAFDAKYAGRIALRDYPLYRILQTAAYLGMDPNNISSIDKVFAALKEQRRLVKTYWKNGAELRLLLANREVWLADVWMPEVLASKDKVGLRYWFPKEGGPAWAGGLTIAKGSKNRDTVDFFLNWMLTPERMLNFALTAGEVPTISRELFDVAKYRREHPDMAAYMDALAAKSKQVDVKYALSHPEWVQRYEEMKAGG
jgi:spermidine/putrescine-binding protein